MIRINQWVPYKLIDDMKLSCKRTSFYENGKKKWETDFVNGVRHGKAIPWSSDGNKEWEDDYVNGEMV